MARLKAANPGQLVTFALIVGGAIFLLVGSLDSTNFAKFTVEGVAQGMVYGSLALALVLIYQATHVINFAQGELAMLTTFIAYQLTQWGLSYWEAFPATVAIAFLIGMVLQVTVIRPVQHRSVIATVIVTVGLFTLIDGIVNWKWGESGFLTLPSAFGFGSWDVGGVLIFRFYVGTVVVVLASLVVVWVLFRFTKLGLAMRAAALRPASASLAGVRVDAMLAIGWGLAAALGAVAGLMNEASPFSSLDPTFMQSVLVFAFAAAALGGLESPVGAVVGGLAIGVLQTLLIGYVPQISTELQIPFSFALILIVLVVKPTGLFGSRQVVRV